MSVEDGPEGLGGALATDSRTAPAVVGAGALLSVLTGWLVAGLGGALAGVVVVAAWLVVSPIVVLAVGHVLLAAVLPENASLATLALAQAPMVVVFAGSVLDADRPSRTLWQGVVALAALSLVVAGSIATFGTRWQVAAILVAVVAVAGYGLHRYTVATLEVTDEY
ncbi:hypothetical protein ACAH01_04160 [Halomicrobium sp. HM KBTZ05]|uniref:hypothetical protein n=1 Tax=Halomicrobium sp. HM KBTZ05 TaxID=3242663 RepID=UPI0035582134